MDWIYLNAQGLIPGPSETEEEFLTRVDTCLHIKEKLSAIAVPELSFLMEDRHSEEALHEAFAITRPLFGIEPAWVPLFFTDHQLSPWHGGCAWIFRIDDQTPTSGFIQLRSRFRTSGSILWGLYDRKELDSSRVGSYQEWSITIPNSKEIIAYRASSTKTATPLWTHR